MGLESLAEFKSSVDSKRPALLQDYRSLLLEIIHNESGKMTDEQKLRLEGLMDTLGKSAEDVMAEATAIQRANELHERVIQFDTPRHQERIKAAEIAIFEHKEDCRIKIAEMNQELDRLCIAKGQFDREVVQIESARRELQGLANRFPDLIAI